MDYLSVFLNSISVEGTLAVSGLKIYLFVGAVSLYVFWKYLSKGYDVWTAAAPPGPIALPIVGYLPFLGKEPYRKLHDLSQHYGNVMRLKMGKNYVVFLGDFTAVKEAFSKSSTIDRPPAMFDIMPGGFGFSSVNGEEWYEQRRFSLKVMRELGLGRSKWEMIVQEEVEEFVKMLTAQDGRSLDVVRLLTASVSNNISSLIFGKRLPIDDESINFVNQHVDAVSQFFTVVGLRNYFPWIAKFTAKLGIFSLTAQQKKLMEFGDYIRNQVANHLNNKEDHISENFIGDYMLEIKRNEEQNLNNTFNKTNLYGNIQALFIGATDTTRTSINWLLIAMALYPDIQKKAHQEIDSVLGKDGKINWADRATLPYLMAVVMEGQRWKTVAPLNTPRIAQEDINICGYDIPKGTVIVANNWGLHNDTRYWKNPEEFFPERFLSTDGKRLNLKPDSYVPFSLGKRNCPGEVVAMMEMLFYMAAILQKFHVLPPKGEIPKLEAILGLTYQAVPQKLRFVTRE